MAEVVLVLGISGVGKSTVIRRVLSKVPENRRPSWLNFGDLMLDILREEGRLVNRDEMKFFDVEDTAYLQRKVAERLSSMDGIVIVDTHMALESPFGFIPGITQSFIEHVKIKHIVIIEAPAKDILSRRSKDKSKRQRFPQTEMDISVQLDLDRAMASSLAVKLGVPIKVIENIDLDKAVDELYKTWEAILWK